MKEIISILVIIAAIYLAISACLYLFQRKLIYYPVGLDPAFSAEEIRIDNQGTELHGWIINPGKARAFIYFGGNSEMITHRDQFFTEVFADYSVYLINYRGYGESQGEPTEAGLFSDAEAIYDAIREQHGSVSAYGRSLGSGVAVHLAANRPLDRLVLLTPYDSVARVAQKIYPFVPVNWLIKDRFDSIAVADQIAIPVLIIAAEEDREIKLEHTLALKQQLTRAQLEYVLVSGAAHNDVTEFPQYRAAIVDFISRPAIKPGGF